MFGSGGYRRRTRTVYSAHSDTSMSQPVTLLSTTRRGSGWLLLFAGWSVFFVLWTLFFMGWGQGETTLADASRSALVTTLTAAVLSILVWRFTRRLPWPEELRLLFFLWHLVAAVVFAVFWTAFIPVVFVLSEGGSLAEMHFPEGSWLIWRLFMGVWLYFIVVGVSYSVRINRHLLHQRELALQAESLAAKASLKAMRSQLRPHFLFNALHSVGSLIESNQEKAIDGMERLGDLLRYSIREREDDRVELSEEWAFVEDYIALQELRFGDRILVEADLQPDCMAHRVPPFLIQPLIENAFIHGPGARPSGGFIRVTGHCRDSVLTVTVEDNGPGFVAGTGGSGLDNLRSRLEAIYGEQSGLSVSDRKGGGGRVVITLPLED